MHQYEDGERLLALLRIPLSGEEQRVFQDSWKSEIAFYADDLVKATLYLYSNTLVQEKAKDVPDRKDELENNLKDVQFRYESRKRIDRFYERLERKGILEKLKQGVPIDDILRLSSLSPDLLHVLA
jgi:hypothetical protein